MHSYEVEIKSLLGSKERADEVRAAMQRADIACVLTSRNKQLNHYFEGGSLAKIVEILAPKFPTEISGRLSDLVLRAKDFSVRTRDKDGVVLLVVKASVGDDTSANGIARMEFEENVPMTLAALDALVLSAGFKYQAKWSREREEYLCRGVNVTLDKNAGYGWLAEFERVVNDKTQLASAEAEVRALMQELNVEELPQDRLERMFAFYNTHWKDYYGTERIFMVE
ncbi:MAG: CYTH domain-containing protein [bacterium]|nr:CYTH domain-containing protein [bacterium]